MGDQYEQGRPSSPKTTNCHFERSEKSMSDESEQLRTFRNLQIPPSGRNDRTCECSNDRRANSWDSLNDG